jgi:hypothetical protein
VTDQQEQSGGGSALRFLRPVAIAAAVAGAIIGGRALLERRHAGQGENGGDEAAGAAGADGGEADLGTELRGAASDIAVSLLDRATAKLEG